MDDPSLFFGGLSLNSDMFQMIATGHKAQVIYSLRENPGLASKQNPEGITPVLFALYYGKEDIVNSYIALGIPLNLFEAAALGDEARVKELVDSNPNIVHSYSPDGWTPLHLASHFGRLSIIQYLLDKGADIHAKSKSKLSIGNTALHSAVASWRADAVALLLENGADPNFTQEGGFSPLHIAASRHGNEQIVSLLIKKGADPDLKTEDGKTARDIAAERGVPFSA
ncbi:ankyrin repeat domain-containing protein [Leptospira licerasiae]|uniref:ankyrin repeat domain-containing protein n=1 Tax=Leptospira licerasiae TaxID=447106 RepID=UPI00024888CB|nr:ankyrin repeat domain-containing protein [Leptospira licerasiae]EIE00851.1 ankyrin repeat protein [Leptospira licerasiae serovar Varillal str. VAR 010]